MSKTVKIVVTLGFVAVVAACGQQEEEVVYTPIPAEPVQTGKYK